MEKIKTLLIDDEQDSREVLMELLKDFSNEIEIIGEAWNVDEAFREINEKMPQLVFLDIQMPRANGFALLKKFEQIPFEVVFVTSFDEYAINAIKFSALDYLLKPVEPEDLATAVKKAINSIRMKYNNGPQVINLLHSLEGDVKDRKIALHSGDKVKLLSENQILYIEGDARYSHVFMNTGENYTTPKFLKDFEEYFGSGFVRISKSYLINIRQIKEYSKGEPCVIEMIDGKTFEVSRRKKGEVLERLKE